MTYSDGRFAAIEQERDPDADDGELPRWILLSTDADYLHLCDRRRRLRTAESVTLHTRTYSLLPRADGRFCVGERWMLVGQDRLSRRAETRHLLGGRRRHFDGLLDPHRVAPGAMGALIRAEALGKDGPGGWPVLVPVHRMAALTGRLVAAGVAPTRAALLASQEPGHPLLPGLCAEPDVPGPARPEVMRLLGL